MKYWWWILIILGLIILTYFITKNLSVRQAEVESDKEDNNFRIKEKDDYDIITLKLPHNSDPAVFGPVYWNAFHKLAGLIPCPTCREEGVSFIKFFHDVKNKSLEKGFYDKENYSFWIDYLTKTNEPKS